MYIVAQILECMGRRGIASVKNYISGPKTVVGTIYHDIVIIFLNLTNKA